MTSKDETADLSVHERIVFCHILDMRENLEKKRINLEGESKLSSNYDSRMSNSSEKMHRYHQDEYYMEGDEYY